MKLTLIGTGLMGLPMAHHLLDAGFELTVWNRTPAKAAPLCERGAQWAPTPEAAAADADIVVSPSAAACSDRFQLWSRKWRSQGQAYAAQQ